MNTLSGLSFNISFVFNGKDKEEIYQKVRGMYTKSGSSEPWINCDTYEDYVQNHEERIEAEKAQGAVKAAPFTIVDVDDTHKISMLHYGDNSRAVDYNGVPYHKYRVDCLHEIVACLNQDMADEELASISKERAKELIGGNIILLTDNNLIPVEIFEKVYDACQNHFNSFK